MMFYLKSLILITRGGVVSRMMGVTFLFMKGLGWVIPWVVRPVTLGCTFLSAGSFVHV